MNNTIPVGGIILALMSTIVFASSDLTSISLDYPACILEDESGRLKVLSKIEDLGDSSLQQAARDQLGQLRNNPVYQEVACKISTHIIEKSPIQAYKALIPQILVDKVRRLIKKKRDQNIADIYSSLIVLSKSDGSDSILSLLKRIKSEWSEYRKFMALRDVSSFDQVIQPRIVPMGNTHQVNLDLSVQEQHNIQADLSDASIAMRLSFFENKGKDERATQILETFKARYASINKTHGEIESNLSRLDSIDQIPSPSAAQLEEIRKNRNKLEMELQLKKQVESELRKTIYKSFDDQMNAQEKKEFDKQFGVLKEYWQKATYDFYSTKPYLRYLKSPSPKIGEIKGALIKWQESLFAQEKSEEKRKNKPLDAMDYGNTLYYYSHHRQEINEALEALPLNLRGDFCNTLLFTKKSIENNQSTLENIVTALTIGASVVGLVAAPPLALGVAAVASVGAAAFDVQQKSNKFHLYNDPCLNGSSSCDPKKIEELHQEFQNGLILSGVDLVSVAPVSLSGVKTGVKTAIRLLTSRGPALLPVSQARNFFKLGYYHYLNQIKELVPVQQHQKLELAKRWMDEVITSAETPADFADLMHQLNLLKQSTVGKGNVELTRFIESELVPMVLGKLASDFGKVKGQRWILFAAGGGSGFTPDQIKESVRTLELLSGKGKGKVAEALEKYSKLAGLLDSSGNVLPILPNLPVEELAKGMASGPHASYLHEVFGKYKLIKAFEEDAIDESEFIKSIHVLFAHNGGSPVGSFLKMFTGFIPQESFLRKGVSWFSKEVDGVIKPVYPDIEFVRFWDPKTGNAHLNFDNILHQFHDRRGGLYRHEGPLKFMLESAEGSMSFSAMVESMIKKNPEMTNTQFRELRQRLETLVNLGPMSVRVAQNLEPGKAIRLTKDEISKARKVIERIDQAEMRSRSMTEFFHRQITTLADGERKMEFIDFTGQKVVAIITDNEIKITRGKYTRIYDAAVMSRKQIIQNVLGPLGNEMVIAEQRTSMMGSIIR